MSEAVHRSIDAVWRIESAKLIAALTRLVRDVGLAEELAQDALVAALEQWPQEGIPTNPAAWLMATAKHRAIDRLRSGRMQREAAPIEFAAAVPDAAPLAEDLLIDAERKARVHHCLGQLDENQRDNIRAAFFDGRTYAELAEAGGVPLGTMKSWIRRGMMRLKACLEDAA